MSSGGGLSGGGGWITARGAGELRRASDSGGKKSEKKKKKKYKLRRKEKSRTWTWRAGRGGRLQLGGTLVPGSGQQDSSQRLPLVGRGLYLPWAGAGLGRQDGEETSTGRSPVLRRVVVLHLTASHCNELGCFSTMQSPGPTSGNPCLSILIGAPPHFQTSSQVIVVCP